MTTSEIETTSIGETADPARFIVVSRHEVLAKLVDALAQGASFLALTGLPGVGKTTMAAAVQELLAARSVAALHIGRGESGAIRLRTLASQLLGKPEDAINGHDAERLFDLMTAHGSSGRRLVIIVDDAELMHTEVFAYLRLLMSIGIEPVPQFLFVGDPSFWHRAAEATHANVRDLITDWVDLEPLTWAESREFAELLLGSAGPAAGAALNQAALDELVRASHGQIGRLLSLLASAAMLPGEVPRAQVADPGLDDATAVASGERGIPPQSENQAGWLPEDAVPVQDRLDPEVAAALFGSRSLGHGPAKPRRVPVFASLAGVLMLAGLVGAVTYRWILDPSDHGARAEPAMIVEASNDGVHSTPPDTAVGAQSEPGFEIMHSAQAAIGGALGADKAPAASTTATSEAVAPPARGERTVPAASLTASSPGVGVPREARLSVLSMVFSDDAAVTKVASGVEEPPAGSTPLTPAPIPASRAATEPPAVPPAPPAGPFAPAPMTVDATAVPAVVQPEGPSPAAATVPSQAGTDTPAVPAIAQPAAASSSTETEAPAFAPPAATPSALTDAVNAGANEAGPPAGTQSAAPPPAGNNVVSLPVVPPPAASTGATDAAATDAPADSATVQPLAPSSAAQSEPPVSDAQPPAAPSEAMKSDATGLATGPTAAGTQPSASVPAPTAAVAPVSSTPAVAPSVPDAVATAAPAIPAAGVQPVTAPPATQSQAAANAAPTLAAPSKAPAVTSASPRFVPPALGSLLSRGDAMLALGDISAARLLYERAAALGSAIAATTLGKTYDPAFLASIQVSGLAPNRAAAASWYRKGADLGDAEATDRLARLANAQ